MQNGATKREEGEQIPPAEPKSVEAAELYLIHKAQRELKIKDIKILQLETEVGNNKLGYKKPILMVGGRVRIKYHIGYDKSGISVLPQHAVLAEL
jgi:hypothetical protein